MQLYVTGTELQAVVKSQFIQIWRDHTNFGWKKILNIPNQCYTKYNLGNYLHWLCQQFSQTSVYNTFLGWEIIKKKKKKIVLQIQNWNFNFSYVTIPICNEANSIFFWSNFLQHISTLITFYCAGK